MGWEELIDSLDELETEHIREYLKTNFNIQRVPCYWWLLSLLAIVTPESLNRCMMTWVSGIAPGLVGKIGETGTEGKK